MNVFLRILNITVFFLIIHWNVFSQCIGQLKAFTGGEKVTYQAYYNWGFIWIHAADVQFTVQEKLFGTQSAYFLQATGNSLKSYDWVYKVRDKFQSVIDKDKFTPLWFEQNTLEGGYKVHQTFSFLQNSSKVQIVSETSKKPIKRDSITVTPCTFDVLSAVYFCRTINFEQYKKNDKIPVSAIIDGKVYSLYLRFLGKENIKIHEGKDMYRCIKFSALLVEGTIFKGGEDMFIWVTDDDNRIPVLVEAKILIGSVKAFLNTTEGLKNPMSAKVK